MRLHRKYLPLALFFGTLAVYLLFPTKNYYWDGIDFAHDIENNSWLNPTLLHVNHLIYSPFGRLVYAAARGLGSDARAVDVLQVTNSLLSVACAVMLFVLLKRVTRSDYLSVCLTALYSFSATWWKFSTDADSYIVGTLLLVAAFFFLLPEGRPRPLTVAALHSLGMLFHQLAVFFFPAAVAGILFQTRSLPARRRAFLLLQYCAASFILTISAYYLGFYLRTNATSPRGFVSWVSSYSSGSGGFSFDLLSNLTFTLRGHLRLFANGRVNLLSGILSPFVVILLVALFVLFILLCLRLSKSFGELGTLWRGPHRPFAERPVEVLCVLWIVPYVLFQFFFYPQDTFHRLFYLPAIVMLGGSALARFRAPRRGRLALFVAVLALSNFCFFIYPYTYERNYPPLDVALKLKREMGPGSVVYFADSTGDARLTRYFNPAASWVQFRPGGLEDVTRQLDEAASGGASVWLETSAIARIESLPGGHDWLGSLPGHLSKVELVNRKHNIRYHQVR